MDTRPAIGDSAAPYRTADQRLAVAAACLIDHRDCWFITADPENGPHAVPLSFLAIGPRVILATAPNRPAARNIALNPRVVLVLAGFGDAIRFNGEAEVVPFADLEGDVQAQYIAKAEWDPRAAGFIGLVVTLSQILCSRSPAEDRDRVVWKAGTPTPW
jgi:hypothetical protein